MDGLDQRTLAWYEARLGKATASRFADVMAKIRTGESAARKNYRAELVTERLTGEPTVSYQNGAMQWGIDNEPVARLGYELHTGNTVKEAFFEKHPTLEAGASPDGYINDDGLVEIKCPNTATHIETIKSQSIPKQYIPQIQGQLWITGRQWCDFVSYDPRLPENAQLFIKRVERDDEYITNLEKEVTQFLAEVDSEQQFVENYKEAK